MIVRLALLFLAVFDFACDAYKALSMVFARTARHLSHLTIKPIAKTSTAA